MLGDLLVELLGVDNQVLLIAREVLLIRVARVPDSGLTHEVESCLMDDWGNRLMRVSPEEDRGSEDSLKGANQPTVLRASLLQPEGVEHFRGAGEGDPARPLPVRQSCQEQRNQAILSPG